MGAPLQYLIMKKYVFMFLTFIHSWCSPAVEFCAYSQPHPTDDLIHLRIQTDGSVTAADALAEGIHNLMDIGLHILNKYEANLEHGEYEIQPSPSV